MMATVDLVLENPTAHMSVFESNCQSWLCFFFFLIKTKLSIYREKTRLVFEL